MNTQDIIKQRIKLLSLLYDARLKETRARQGYISHNDLSDAVGECQFNLSILEELGQLKKDGYKYRISGKGAERLEKHIIETNP